MSTFAENLKAASEHVTNMVTEDRPGTHGDFPNFAETFRHLHEAYIAGCVRAGRAPNVLDSYSIQIIQKLARIANGPPEKAAAHFEDIAGYGLGATAHVMTMLDLVGTAR